MKRNDGLEVVFSKGHELHNRIFYCPVEGKYYDKHTDLFLSLEEAQAYGLYGSKSK